MNSYLRGLRLERWPRSTAIFLGSAAYFYLHREALASWDVRLVLVRLAVAFLLTWAISTANYIVNEIVDAPFDAHHPVKRDRPYLRGEIRKGPFLLLGAAISAAAFLLAVVCFSRAFVFSLLALLIAGFVYNLKPVRTKDIPFLDSISESANNPIRFLIGWFSFAPRELLPPPDLLVAWWSFGNFLMTAKRLSEFRLLKDRAVDYRMSHKRYSKSSLLLGMIASAAVFLTSFLGFAVRLRLRWLGVLLPLLLLYLLLFFRKTLGEQEIMEEPESLLQNPLIAGLTGAILILLVLSFFLR